MSAAAQPLLGPPARDEAAEYYFRYIDRITSPDVLGVLERQAGETLAYLEGISEEGSLRRYEPAKWSMRQVLNHVTDCERVFVSRAFWFARGFDSELPSFDQNTSADAARADDVAWSDHVEEFRGVRRSTISFFRNLPREAWMRRGIASGYPFTVRALAFIIAGHLAHHESILRERYS